MISLMTRARVKALRETYLRGFRDDSVPFWLKHAYDPVHGGYMTCVERDGTLFDTDKGIWHQGRFAWMLGHLYNHFEKRPEYLECAKKTLDFLAAHGFDSDGHMFFHVTQNGDPIRKRRYAFSESFAAVAFGEYARATGDESAKKRAEMLCRAFINHVPSPAKFTDVRPMKGMAPLMITIVTCQQLRESIQLPDADALIDAAIEEIHRDFMKPDIQCCMESVALDGSIVDHVDGRILNPGHAIEGAWFIMNEGRIRNKPEYIQCGLQILDWMWARGWDRQFGGLLYFRDVYNKPVVEYWQDMKFWWNHNEAIIASLMAFLLTGDEKYAAMHQTVHDWAFAHFPDPEFGEWYGYLHRDGTPATTQKGNLYKGCFHVPRMHFTCYELCNDLLRKMDGGK